MIVLKYKAISSSNPTTGLSKSGKISKLRPADKINRIKPELKVYLEDRDAKVKILNVESKRDASEEVVECNFQVTTTQSELEVDMAVSRCMLSLDLEWYREGYN